MKNFCKKLLVFVGILSTISITISFTNQTPASAALDRCNNSFLGLTSWDCNLKEMKSEHDLTDNVVTIASNILTDITVIAAYLVLGYVIYGGYLYMFSSGDPGKAAAGKKTLQHAFIGLAITMSAYTIFSGIRIALIGNNSLGSCDITSTGTACVTADAVVTNLIQWIFGMAGVVAAIFIVVGGWGYITAAGDPGKLQKAKTTLLYAIIGITIVALAEFLTAFISSLIRDANETSFKNNQSIAININKENL